MQSMVFDITRSSIAEREIPETKYAFKAQKDQRTFAENLIYIAYNEYEMISAINGKRMGPLGDEDSVKRLF